MILVKVLLWKSKEFKRHLIFLLLGCYLCSFISCIEPKHEHSVANEYLQDLISLDKNDNKLKGVLIVPIEGCSNCVNTAINFVKENIKEENILYVLTSVSGKKDIQIKFKDFPLTSPNIFIDETFKTIKLGIVESYPVLYYMENGTVIEKQDLNGLSVNEGLYDLQKRMGIVPDIPQTDLAINYVEIDKKPQFEGGIQNFHHYIQESFEYPKKAEGIAGRVLMECIIGKTGEMKQVKVLKGVGVICDTLLRKIILASPKWEPGVHNDQLADTRVLVPVVIQIPEKAG